MAQARILIVEDDQLYEDIYRRTLRNFDYILMSTRKFSTAMTLLEEQSFDVIITDLKMMGTTEKGFEVLEQAKSINAQMQVIVVTAHASTDIAMRAIRGGAYDYITKVGRDLRKKLALSVQGAIAEAEGIIGNSTGMKALFEQIDRAAHSQVNVMLRGEGGTGKRLIAKTIHRHSFGKDAPFEIVDCGKLSETMLESELFGYEPGMLYGEHQGKPGKFELAKGGTIFLDGIGDLDFRLQRRLVGAVGDKEITRVGGHQTIPVESRVIASTDKPLEDMISNQHFDRRLFDILNEFAISVPPLRERIDGDDIPALAAMFVQRYRKDDRQIRLSDEAVELLSKYDYPGNVRELESIMKHAIEMTLDEIILSEHLKPEVRHHQSSQPGKLITKEEVKNPNAIMRVCPLNLGECSKKEEIIRLYDPRRVFVNIPYTPDYTEYEQIIRETLGKYSLVPVLSKDDLEPVVLLCNVCKLIQTCKYGITDVSNAESNVLYELGLMHANGIHCAILKDRRARQATDIQGLFFLEYNNPQAMAERLSRWIEHQVKEAHLTSAPGPTTGDLLSTRIQGFRNELFSRYRNLNQLKEQAVTYGAGQMPLHLFNQIEAEQDAISQLEEQLDILSNQLVQNDESGDD